MNDEAMRETFLRGQTLYDGKVVHLEKWDVRLPTGGEAVREVVKHVGAAAIVPVDENGNITLVRQHRVAIDEMTWEIPAGKLNFAGEDPLLAAKRELEEETGLQAETWVLLSKVVTTPGFCTEKISIYMALGLSQHEMHPDADEFLSLRKIPLDDALDEVSLGHFTDLKTIAGILLAARALGK